MTANNPQTLLEHLDDYGYVVIPRFLDTNVTTAVRSHIDTLAPPIMPADLPDQKRMREPFEHNAPVPLDYAAAADLVTKYHQPGDAVVYDRQDTWKLDSGIQYYLPRDLKMRDVFLARTPTAVNELYAVQCPVPDLCLRGERRIWLLTQGSGPDPFEAISTDQASALRTRYRATMSASVTGMTVTLLVRKGRS